ncbi:MAG: zinc ribbon domain-containing protein [Chloroflexi bacterium]|nr:zinc ribbon domain-containing protein [Chloroflexota bacterium]
MPRYDYRCTVCALEFEVSRSFSQASDPVNCPVDQGPCERLLRMPTVFVRGKTTESGSPNPNSRPSAPSPSPSWSHFGHSHGAGAGSHSH